MSGEHNHELPPERYNDGAVQKTVNAALWNDAEFCERAVIGRMLEHPDETVSNATFLLTAEHIKHTIRRCAFVAISDLFAEKAPIELASVGRRMAATTPGPIGAVYAELIECRQITTGPANLAYYAKGVLQHARLTRIKGDATSAAKSDATSAEEVTEMLEKAISDAMVPDDSEPEHIGAVLERSYGELAEEAEGRTTTRRTRVGLAAFDGMLGGLRGGELIVIGARPGAGKTTVALQIAEEAARSGPVLFFSLEMSKRELSTRTFARMAHLPQTALRDAAISPDSDTWRRLDDVVRSYQNRPVYIVDESRMTINRIVAMSERLAMRERLALIVVDYVQLIRTKGRFDSREQEVAHISREMKSMARTLKTPVIALAQLNREMEKKNRRPVLSDLRESGSLEQDADAVVFIHRPYLTDTTVPPDETEIIVAKNRHGETGTTDVRFIVEQSRFVDRSGGGL